MASSTGTTALALVQPLHGLTFALLHLACMPLIATHVPAGLEGTAQAFWAMAALCGLALLFALAWIARSRDVAT